MYRLLRSPLFFTSYWRLLYSAKQLLQSTTTADTIVNFIIREKPKSNPGSNTLWNLGVCLDEKNHTWPLCECAKSNPHIRSKYLQTWGKFRSGSLYCGAGPSLIIKSFGILLAVSCYYELNWHFGCSAKGFQTYLLERDKLHFSLWYRSKGLWTQSHILLLIHSSGPVHRSFSLDFTGFWIRHNKRFV